MTKNHPPTIQKRDLLALLFHSISDIKIADLGQWLECKTENGYTIVEYEFLRDTFILLDTINTMNLEFKTKWFNSLDTVKIRDLK